MVNWSFGESGETDHDDRDIVTWVTDLMPDLAGYFH